MYEVKVVQSGRLKLQHTDGSSSSFDVTAGQKLQLSFVKMLPGSTATIVIGNKIKPNRTKSKLKVGPCVEAEIITALQEFSEHLEETPFERMTLGTWEKPEPEDVPDYPPTPTDGWPDSDPATVDDQQFTDWYQTELAKEEDRPTLTNGWPDLGSASRDEEDESPVTQ